MPTVGRARERRGRAKLIRALATGGFVTLAAQALDVDPKTSRRQRVEGCGKRVRPG